jgi:hypothetical protein
MLAIFADFYLPVCGCHYYPTVVRIRHTLCKLLHPIARLAAYSLVVLLILPTPIEATSFVLVRVGTKLYIGADGFRVDYSTYRHEPHCKIAVNQGTVTLTWGLVGMEVRSSEGQIKQSDYFSTQVEAVSASSGTVAEKRDMLIPKAREFMLRSMRFRDSQSPPVTPEIVANFSVGAAFVSMKRGVPDIGAFDLKIKNWEAREIEEVTYPDLRNWDWSASFAFGNVQAFVEIIQMGDKDGSIRIQAKTKPTAFIRRVLSRQHEFTPNDVGPPYAIAVLSGNTFTLIEKGACNNNDDN